MSTMTYVQTFHPSSSMMTLFSATISLLSFPLTKWTKTMSFGGTDTFPLKVSSAVTTLFSFTVTLFAFSNNTFRLIHTFEFTWMWTSFMSDTKAPYLLAVQSFTKIRSFETFDISSMLILTLQVGFPSSNRF